MVDVDGITQGGGRVGGYELDHILLYNRKGKLLGDADIEALQCLHCVKLLREPCQLIGCGHRFCRSCLDNEILKRNPKVCPDDGEPILDRHVKSDKGCMKEIKSLSAVCGGKDNGCTYTGTIEEVEFHVSDCAYITVPCPNGCGQSLSRSNLKSHLNQCPKKPDAYQLFSTLLERVNVLENGNSKLHSENAKLHQLVFALQGKVSESQTEITNLQHQVKEIPLLKNEITDLNHELTRLKGAQLRGERVVSDSGHQRSSHPVSLDDAGGKHNPDPGYVSDTFNRASLAAYSSSSSSSSGFSSSTGSSFSSAPYSSANSSAYSSPPNSYPSTGDEDVRAMVKKLQMDVNSMRPCVDDFSRMHSQLVGYMETVQTVQESVTRHAVAMEEIKLRQDILDVKTSHGIFIWKIPEISRRYNDAQQRRTLSLYSPPFHTSPHGYRMCIRAYLNGDGSGKGTHISVFFVLMKSEHDNLLTWPFKSPVTFQLLNLDNPANHITETFMPDVQSPSFQQPKSEMNIASGFPRFAKQAILKDPSFTKGDAIFIRCEVKLKDIDFKE